MLVTVISEGDLNVKSNCESCSVRVKSESRHIAPPSGSNLSGLMQRCGAPSTRTSFLMWLLLGSIKVPMRSIDAHVGANVTLTICRSTGTLPIFSGNLIGRQTLSSFPSLRKSLAS